MNKSKRKKGNKGEEIKSMNKPQWRGRSRARTGQKERKICEQVREIGGIETENENVSKSKKEGSRRDRNREQAEGGERSRRNEQEERYAVHRSLACPLYYKFWPRDQPQESFNCVTGEPLSRVAAINHEICLLSASLPRR